jgi:hypothetical protein
MDTFLHNNTALQRVVAEGPFGGQSAGAERTSLPWAQRRELAPPLPRARETQGRLKTGQGDATWRGEHPDTARLLAGDVVAAVEALKDEPGDELQIWEAANCSRRCCGTRWLTASA